MEKKEKNVQTVNYKSTKKIILGSCCFRQPEADSHCKYLHGYNLYAKLWFECIELDKNNWVVDFGSLKQIRNQLKNIFDHTTIISVKDPEIKTFELLHKKGIIDLRILDGVGIEKFAEYVFKEMNRFIYQKTRGRCWVYKCEIWEHDLNSAIYKK
jgi:6-pyruvoyltetrahydropterin/6-carboxytetrahydropterin synthase